MTTRTKKLNIEKVQNNLFMMLTSLITLSLFVYLFSVFKTTAHAYDIRTTEKILSQTEESVLILETEVSLGKGLNDMEKAPELGYVSSAEDVVYLKPRSQVFSFNTISDKIR